MFGQELWCLVKGCDVWSRVVVFGQRLSVVFGLGLWCLVKGCDIWSRVVVFGQEL